MPITLRQFRRMQQLHYTMLISYSDIYTLHATCLYRKPLSKSQSKPLMGSVAIPRVFAHVFPEQVLVAELLVTDLAVKVLTHVVFWWHVSPQERYRRNTLATDVAHVRIAILVDAKLMVAPALRIQKQLLAVGTLERRRGVVVTKCALSAALNVHATPPCSKIL